MGLQNESVTKMMGQWLHYTLVILLSIGALVTFLFSWWKKQLDWSEEPSKTLFLDESDE